ncbi:MAG: RNA ligase family protein [Candidatus Pacearchaeota archaeon]
MAFFGVTKEKIGTVDPIPEADKIVKASLEGISFSFVIGKDTFQPGDSVLYIPIDSLLPLPLQEKLNLVGKLAGSDKNRVKTVRLRGVISQGIVAPLSLLDGINNENPTTEEITAFLGVTKYDPPIVDAGGYNLHKLPEVSPYYDIEGCERNPEIVSILMDLDVVVTEKLEGRNSSVAYLKDEPEARFCQRSGEIVLIDNNCLNVTHETAKKQLLDVIAKKIVTDYSVEASTIRGELIGHSSAQGDYYKLKKAQIHTFEVWLNGQPIDYPKQEEITKEYGILTVPVLFVGKLRDYLKGRNIAEVSNGLSVLNPALRREGIVIRPYIELPRDTKLGRIILKQRSPEYLAKTEN